MSAEIQLRDFLESDVAVVRGLFELIFGQEMSERRWRWMFLDNPFGRGLCPLAFAEGQLIGQSAAVALPFRDGGAQYPTVRIQNVMVDANYRGGGIFSRLLIENTQLADARGVPFIYAFPNPNSLPAFLRKAGYSLLHEIPTLRRSSNSLGELTGTNVELRIEGKGSFDARDVDLFERSGAKARFRTDRSLAYLQWRFDERSDRDYVIVRAFGPTGLAMIAIAKYYAAGRTVDLVELAGDTDPQLITAILKQLTTHFGRDSVDAFETWAFGANPLAPVLTDLGFAPTGRKTNLVFRWHPTHAAPAPTFDQFLISMGDSDVY